MFARQAKDRALALLIVVASVAVSASVHARSGKAEVKEVTLAVGAQISIPARGVAKYSEGVAGIVDVRLPDDAEEFIVVGLRPGTTTLLLVYDDGRKKQFTFVVNAAGTAVTKSENIRLNFYFVELSNSKNHQVGVAWPTSIGSGATFESNYDVRAGTLSQATATITGHPLPRLDLLEASGWARVARHATLITANGKEAVFNSGGEVNIAVEGSLAAEIRSIDFGSIVRVLPRYDKDSGRLELKIKAEFSSLTGSSAVPGRSVSNVETIVNVEVSQAVVLAGLSSESETRNKEGLPLLSRIPVIGHLFGRTVSRKEKLQNVVFIVPSVVDVVAMDARRQIDDAMKAFARYEGDLAPVLLLDTDGKK